MSACWDQLRTADKYSLQRWGNMNLPVLRTLFSCIRLHYVFRMRYFRGKDTVPRSVLQEIKELGRHFDVLLQRDGGVDGGISMAGVEKTYERTCDKGRVGY